MTLFEFIEDLKREIEENKSWAKMELEFCTIDGGGAKYSSIYESKGTIYIEVSIKEKQQNCEHKNTETIYGYIPGEAVKQPEYEMCLDCGLKG